MNLLRLMLVLFVAQSQPAPQAARGSIDGFVVKLGTSQPVSKARVMLTRNQGRGESYAATTESGGRFAFQNLEPGEYRLSVTRNGYVRSEYGQRSLNRPGLPLTVNAGQKVSDVVLQIVPAGTIAGRIYDRDGEPLPNVNVQAMRYVYREGSRILTSVQQARTNDLGEYRLFWLNPGQYYVSATPNEGGRMTAGTSPIAGPGIGGAISGGRGGPPAGRGGARGAGRGEPQAGVRGGMAAIPAAMMDVPSEDEGYIPTYFPNTTDAQSAAPIQLPPGVLYPNVDLIVSPVRTLRVRGQVVDGTTGQPARGIQVMLVQRQQGGGFGMNGNFRGRNPDDSGVFEIRGVVPGSYDIVATMNNRNSRMTARVPIDVGGSDVENVTLVLSPGYPIAGHIAIENRPASPNDSDLTRMRINLRSDAPQGGPAGPPPSGAVQPNGTFTLPQVGPGDYRIMVGGIPQNHYVKVARFGSVDVLNQGLRVSGQPSGQLETLVSPNTASIEGSVVDDKQRPAINVTVVLVPDGSFRQRFDLYRVVSTDANGRFRLQGITPADYRLFAWEDVEQGAWQDPEFIRLYQDYGKAYRFTEGSQTTVDLRLIPAQM
jgi:protocatechuate 3,4-dioxygenase beta subunit